MSAIILNFPSKPDTQKPKGKKPHWRPNTKNLHMVINVDRMRRYRVLDIGAVKMLGSAQWDLVKLVERCASGGQASAEELENLMWRFASALRTMDFADGFLVVHGKPLDKATNYKELRSQWLPMLCNAVIPIDDFR